MAESLLLKNVRIVSPGAGLNGQTADILIENGNIARIGTGIDAPNGSTVFERAGAMVSIGWIDVGVQTCDPGYEHREDLFSVAAAAAAGGFTAVAPYPNTDPAADSKGQILYIQNKTRGLLVDFYPIGAISIRCEGKDLAEILDMREAGAVAFSDGKKSVQDPGLLLRALQYAQVFDGLVMNFPNDRSISGAGQIHEGLTSVSLGLTGIPSMAEELMLERDLQLLTYSGGRLQAANISTAHSVALVKAAKKAGYSVTASIAAMNLAFDESMLADFDPNYKVSPPLRSKKDREALQKGLADGVIDFIASNHVPVDSEGKNVEFAYAAFGAIGLETAWALANTFLKGRLTIEELVEKWAVNARRILRLPVPVIAEGKPANLTIFDPALEWVVDDRRFLSKSVNTPLTGMKLTGKVLGVVNNGRWKIFEEQ